MTLRTEPWPAGVPCYADLMAPDVPTAIAFYGAVFGWSFTDPDPQYGGYVVAQVDGHAAAGIGPVMGDAPIQWRLYLASDDVAKTVAAITEHGGTVVVGPDEVGPLGSLAIALDPTGAAFGVWQAGIHLGSEIVNQAGGLAWEDLRSSDPDTARAFYQSVFGYRFDTLEMAGPAYTMFALPDQEAPLGGIGDMMGMDGAGSQWLVYFGVADADAAAAAAESNGGAIAVPGTDTPFGRMYGLTDPAGALFWIVAITPAAS